MVTETSSSIVARAQPGFLLLPGGTQKKYMCLAGARSEAAEG